MQIRVKLFVLNEIYIYISIPASHLYITYDYSVKISHPDKRDPKGVFQNLSLQS